MERAVLDPEPAAVAAERLAKVAELVLHEAVDSFAGLADRLADVVLDPVHRDAIDELSSVLARPRGPRRARRDCAASGPLRPAHDRSDGTLSRGTASKEQGRCGADRRADERCGEQVVLRITPNLAVAGGLADAWPPLRAGRDRCSHRRVPLALDRSRSARPRPRCEARLTPCAPRAPWMPSR